MAEKRKLLNEIDKCYKKIDEGFEIFDDIMAKMVEANSENQREKFQDDLKKEIKKLQRLRDQIKGWQNSSDIKDKDSLSKYRKMIEQRMEIFKDVERENKTKPHSKQGLSAEDKLDPKEKEKSDTIEWLNCQIRRIQDEIDRAESKLETLSSTAETGKKRGKKDDAKRNENEKNEELRKHLERVKFHLMNLEVCMRMINNEKLEIKDVLSKLKEPLEMYIDALDPENEEDPETLDPEDIYEELNFGTYLSQLGGMSMNSIDDDKIGPNNENAFSPTKKFIDDKCFKAKSMDGSELILNSILPLAVDEVTTNGSSIDLNNDQIQVSVSSNTSTEQPRFTFKQDYAKIVTIKNPSLDLPISTNTSTVQPSTFKQDDSKIGIIKNPSPDLPVSSNTSTVQPSTFKQDDSKIGIIKNPSLDLPVSSNTSTVQPSTFKQDDSKIVTIKNPSLDLLLPVDYPKSSIQILSGALNDSSESIENLMDQIDSGAVNINLERHQKNKEPQETVIPPWLGASPLGMVPMNDELNYHLQILDTTLLRCPVQMDSEKPRSYLPKMPCQTPSYYPQAPLPNADSLEYYLRLSVETLFFTFYYMEGSRAQLLAAKALKKLSWRFHTKYLMWFQRHEEPKQITDDYEQGTYVYFDFEKWVQRKKEQFTFEYKYLEDKDFE